MSLTNRVKPAPFGVDYVPVGRGFDEEDEDATFQSGDTMSTKTPPPSSTFGETVDPNVDNVYRVVNDEGDESSDSGYDSESDDVARPAPTVLATFLADDEPTEEEPRFSGNHLFKTKSKRVKESGDLIQAAEAWGVIICSVHLAAFLYFVFAVLFQIPWKNGLYGDPLLHESSLVRDHFGVIWIFAVFTLCNLFVPAVVMWIISNLDSYTRKDLGQAIVVCQLFLIGFTIVSLCVMLLGYCNTGIFRNVACDDANTTAYCKRWADDNPAGCPRNGVSDDTIVLSENTVYDKWLFVLAALFVIDAVIAYTIHKVTALAYFGHFRFDYGRYRENTKIMYRVDR